MRATSCAALTLVLALATTIDGRAAEPDKPKVAVMSLAPNRVSPDAVKMLDEMLLNELARRDVWSVISTSDIASLLGFDAMKNVVGCSDTSCIAEVGGALGVRYVLAGTVGRLGTSLVVTLKLLDSQNAVVAKRAEYTVKDDEDQYAVAIRAAVGQLVGQEAKDAGKSAGKPADKSAAAAADPGALPAESEVVASSPSPLGPVLRIGLTALAVAGLGVFAWQGLEARSLSQSAGDVKAGTAAGDRHVSREKTAAHLADAGLAVAVLSAVPAAILWWQVEF